MGRYSQSKHEQYLAAAARLLRFRRDAAPGGRLEKLGLSKEEIGMFGDATTGTGSPLTATHWGMFVPALRSESSDAQRAKWLPLAQEMAIVGCYGEHTPPAAAH